MQGATSSVAVSRPVHASDGRDSGTTTSIGSYSVRIQYADLDAATDKVGLVYRATLTAPKATDLRVDDLVSWDGRTWRVRSAEHADGIGGLLRATLITVTQKKN